MTAETSPETTVRAPELSFTRDCDIPPLTGKPPPRPPARLAAASARNSGLASKRYPCFREHPPDRGRLDGAEKEAGHRDRKQIFDVRQGDGRQRRAAAALRHGAEELHAVMREPRRRGDRDPGDDHEEAHRGSWAGSACENVSSTSAAPPTSSADPVGLVDVPEEVRHRSQKSPWPPGNPKSFGSCVLAIWNATPHLNPTSTVSEMKLTSTPALTSHASAPRPRRSAPSPPRGSHASRGRRRRGAEARRR